MQHIPIADKRRGSWLAVSVISMFLVVFALPQVGVAGKPPKVDVCHIPPDNPENFHSIQVNENALQSHLDHGDFVGSCDDHGEQICSDPSLDCDDGDPNTSVDVCDVASDGCVNLPLTAEGQDVSTDGTNSLDLTLVGSDPAGNDLTFTIESGPSAGSITAGPDPIQEPGTCAEAPNAACMIDAECTASGTDSCKVPPVASATVTYAPTSADTDDGFDFRVTGGVIAPETVAGFAIATVNINGTGEVEASSPEVGTIEALDVVVETIEATPVDITLMADAPDSIASLTFAVVGVGPSQGNLGPLVSVTPTEVRHCSIATDQLCETDGDCPGSETCDADLVQPPVRAATVTYTPTGLAPATDSFDFEACDTAAPTVCSTTAATASIDINEEPPLAEDQSIGIDIGEEAVFGL